MLKNLHAYFVLFHLLGIISREVITMNETKALQLIAELHIMDFTNSKPNYADLARKYVSVKYKGGTKVNGRLS